MLTIKDKAEELGRQSSILQLSCVDNVIEDVESGLNFNKKGFKLYSLLSFLVKSKRLKLLKKIVYYVLDFLFLNDYVLILM